MELNNSVKEAVAQKIASSGRVVFDRVVSFMAEETIDKRVKQIIQSYTEIDNLNKELKKFKPDQVSYNIDGSVHHSSYSKEKIDALKKVQDRLEKVTKAINKALENNDYSDLMSLGNGL